MDLQSGGLIEQMNTDIIFTLIWCILGVVMLVYYSKRKFPVLSGLFGMMSGGGTLLLLHFYGDKIGIITELNFFNTMISLILGIPGVCMLALTEKFL